MYDTARRVELVKRQIRKNTRRRQKRGIGRLSAVCMLLFAVLLQTADRVIGQGQTDAGGGFGAMLLREDAGGYVLVASGSKARKTREKTGQASPPDTNRRRKANEETNTQHPAPMLHGADTIADNCVCGR